MNLNKIIVYILLTAIPSISLFYLRGNGCSTFMSLLPFFLGVFTGTAGATLLDSYFDNLTIEPLDEKELLLNQLRSDLELFIEDADLNTLAIYKKFIIEQRYNHAIHMDTKNNVNYIRINNEWVKLDSDQANKDNIKG